MNYKPHCERCVFLGTYATGTVAEEWLFYCGGRLAMTRPAEGPAHFAGTLVPAMGDGVRMACTCGRCVTAAHRSPKLGLIDKRGADAYLSKIERYE